MVVRFWKVVDEVSHRLIIPLWLQNWICDRRDEVVKDG